MSALAAAPKQNSHTIFVDSDEDLDEFDPSEHFGTVPELLGRTHNRLRREQLGKRREIWKSVHARPDLYSRIPVGCQLCAPCLPIAVPLHSAGLQSPKRVRSPRRN